MHYEHFDCTIIISILVDENSAVGRWKREIYLNAITKTALPQFISEIKPMIIKKMQRRSRMKYGENVDRQTKVSSLLLLSLVFFDYWMTESRTRATGWKLSSPCSRPVITGIKRRFRRNGRRFPAASTTGTRWN